MTFARRVFQIAAIYGLLVLVPQYFSRARPGATSRRRSRIPRYLYGFIGIAVAWQLAFLVIARDPVRYRPLMPVAVVEKLAFGVPAIVLYATGRLSGQMLGAGLIDLSLGVLFVIAFIRTGTATASPRP